MPKLITLDGVALRGFAVIQEADGELRVEATYDVLAGAVIDRSKTENITKQVPPTVLAAIKTVWDALEKRLAVVEGVN